MAGPTRPGALAFEKVPGLRQMPAAAHDFWLQARAHRETASALSLKNWTLKLPADKPLFQLDYCGA